jgi:hypothetical protein
MASNSLHLTTMCLKYRPTVVAAFCIYIACKWSRWEVGVWHTLTLMTRFHIISVLFRHRFPTQVKAKYGTATLMRP